MDRQSSIRNILVEARREVHLIDKVKSLPNLVQKNQDPYLNIFENEDEILKKNQKEDKEI